MSESGVEEAGIEKVDRLSVPLGSFGEGIAISPGCLAGKCEFSTRSVHSKRRMKGDAAIR